MLVLGAVDTGRVREVKLDSLSLETPDHACNIALNDANCPVRLKTWEESMKAQPILTVIFTSLLAAAPAQAAGPKAAEGFSSHVDAKLHFAGNKDMIAHHFCKPVAGGMSQCLLFESDNADARLVGVEVIVGPDAYGKLTNREKPMWHYYRTEVPKVSATLPDLSEE